MFATDWQVVPWGDRDALAILQRKLDCDILVTGHTHVSYSCCTAGLGEGPALTTACATQPLVAGNAWGRVQRQPGCIERMPWLREWRLAPVSKPLCVHPSCTPQEFAAYRHEDRLVISTGSATGAYSALSASDGGRQPTPSFALMDVDGSKVRGGSQRRGTACILCKPGMHVLEHGPVAAQGWASLGHA